MAIISYNARQSRIWWFSRNGLHCSIKFAFHPSSWADTLPRKKTRFIICERVACRSLFFRIPARNKTGMKIDRCSFQDQLMSPIFGWRELKMPSDLSRKKSIAFTPVMWNKLTVNKAISINLHRLTKVFDHTDKKNNQKETL